MTPLAGATQRPFPWRTGTAIIAALCCLVMLILAWQRIATLDFRDPDDALRYVEVRDFLGGQSWFDVSQHRINPPVGGPMHWSRIVDLPIAALILLLRPLFGTAMGDQIALAVAPLLLTCALFAMLALALRRLMGPREAVLGSALLATSLPILIQFMPMRVDHHSWQILMAATVLWAMFGPDARRSGIIAGIAAAFWTHVSSEGLPYAVMFGGVLALGWLADRAAWSRFLSYMLSLALASAVLLLGTRGWPEAAALHCDAMSPGYLWPLVAAAFLPAPARRLIGSDSLIRRLLVLAIAAAGAAGMFLLVARPCLAGPFQSLDPVVYHFWYLSVMEGRPVWEQGPLLGMIIALTPLVGIAGSVLAAVASRDPAARLRWIQITLVAIGAYAVSLSVMRAMAIAQLLALPGTVWLLFALFRRIKRFTRPSARVLAGAALFLLTPIGAAGLIALAMPGDADPDKDEKVLINCPTPTNLATLPSLRPGTILAPVDISSHLLAYTPHSVVGTGHHRNDVGIKDVILAFSGPPRIARAIARKHHAAYLAYCPGKPEAAKYARRPGALIALLDAGRTPDWLRPLPTPAGQTLRVYRVVD